MNKLHAALAKASTSDMPVYAGKHKTTHNSDLSGYIFKKGYYFTQNAFQNIYFALLTFLWFLHHRSPQQAQTRTAHCMTRTPQCDLSAISNKASADSVKLFIVRCVICIFVSLLRKCFFQTFFTAHTNATHPHFESHGAQFSALSPTTP